MKKNIEIIKGEIKSFCRNGVYFLCHDLLSSWNIICSSKKNTSFSAAIISVIFCSSTHLFGSVTLPFSVLASSIFSAPCCSFLFSEHLPTLLFPTEPTWPPQQPGPVRHCSVEVERRCAALVATILPQIILKVD